ncbi:MAG: hypothetical protein WB421_00195, partial [Terriglobales bacterium]
LISRGYMKSRALAHEGEVDVDAEVRKWFSILLVLKKAYRGPEQIGDETRGSMAVHAKVCDVGSTNLGETYRKVGSFIHGGFVNANNRVCGGRVPEGTRTRHPGAPRLAVKGD